MARYRHGVGTKWDRLLDVYADIEADPFWDSYRRPGIRLVRGDGEESAEVARVLLVGEAPGANENGSGRPFIGKAGQVLNQCIEACGWTRDTVFVTNVVKYRPEGNATPPLYDVLHAQEALRREWSIIDPTLTVALGRVAQDALGLSGRQLPHGRLGAFSGQKSVVVMYHPAFGLRSAKAQSWIEAEWEMLVEELEYGRKTWEDWDA